MRAARYVRGAEGESTASCPVGVALGDSHKMTLLAPRASASLPTFYICWAHQIVVEAGRGIVEVARGRACGACGGNGWLPSGYYKKTCLPCGGSGRVR